MLDRAGLTWRGRRAETEDLAGLVSFRLFALSRFEMLSLWLLGLENRADIEGADS